MTISEAVAREPLSPTWRMYDNSPSVWVQEPKTNFPLYALAIKVSNLDVQVWFKSACKTAEKKF